ncbi:MAG: hypothetical protein ABW218_03915, partial [Casimicrobiaceae bacterium]
AERPQRTGPTPAPGAPSPGSKPQTAIAPSDQVNVPPQNPNSALPGRTRAPPEVAANRGGSTSTYVPMAPRTAPAQPPQPAMSAPPAYVRPGPQPQPAMSAPPAQARTAPPGQMRAATPQQPVNSAPPAQMRAAPPQAQGVPPQSPPQAQPAGRPSAPPASPAPAPAQRGGDKPAVAKPALSQTPN